MEPSLDLIPALPSPALGSQTSASGPDGLDADTLAQLGDQFSALLSQAQVLPQGQNEIPQPTGEAPAVAELLASEAPLVEASDLPADQAEPTPAESQAPLPKGFPLNLFATLQNWLHPTPAASAEATPAPESATTEPSGQGAADTLTGAGTATTTVDLPTPGKKNAPQAAVPTHAENLPASPAIAPHGKGQGLIRAAEVSNSHSAHHRTAGAALQPAMPEATGTASNEAPASAETLPLPQTDTATSPVTTTAASEAPVIAPSMMPDVSAALPATNPPLPLQASSSERPAIALAQSIHAVNSAPNQAASPRRQSPAAPNTHAAQHQQSPEHAQSIFNRATASTDSLPLPPETETPVKGNTGHPASAGSIPAQGPQPLTVSELGGTAPNDHAAAISAAVQNHLADLPGKSANKSGNAEPPGQLLNQIKDSLDAMGGTVESAPTAPLNPAAASAPGMQKKFDDATQAIPTDGAPPAIASATDTVPVVHAVAAASTAGASSAQTSAPQQNDNSLPQFIGKAHQQPVDQVAEGTIHSIKNGNRELIIRLNPDNLGEVRVNLISHGNQELSARLIASTRESHELLQSQLHTLKASLESQGLHVGRLSVVLAGSTETRSDMGQQQSQNFQQQGTHQNNARQFDQQQQQQSNTPFADQPGFGQPQQKAGYAQNPGDNRRPNPSSDVSSSESARPENRASANDNGRVSILA